MNDEVFIHENGKREPIDIPLGLHGTVEFAKPDPVVLEIVKRVLDLNEVIIKAVCSTAVFYSAAK